MSENKQRVSFIRSFRQAHVLLKLSFMATFVCCSLLVLELGAYVHLSRTTNLPRYFQSLSGYRVYGNSSDYDLGQGIGYVQGETPPQVTDARGLLSEKPVTIKKPEGVIRIMVSGGSAMAGSGQTTGYEEVKEYPRGTYVWEVSICGQLSRWLREKLPGQKIEVISAAHNCKALHQNLIHWVESLCEYEPDVMVSMDGNNESILLDSDEPYQAWERWFLDGYVNLYNRSKGQEDSKFNLTRLMGIWAQRMQTAGGVGAKSPPTGELYTPAELRALYDKDRATYVRRADRWLKILRHFSAVVRSDDVGFVFALQPLLNRKAQNKELSETEVKFNLRTAPRKPDEVSSGSVCFLNIWDDYLSARIDEVVTEAGGVYVDLGKQMKGLGKDMEFYTDYCHMTPEGNTWVAEQLGERVLVVLRQRGLIK